MGRVEMGEECKPWYSSPWWRDICSIGSNLDQNWFAQGVVKEMKNGRHTRFWEDSWLGDRPLKEVFPRLFLISVQQEASVASLCSGENGWNFIWRRRLFVWETNLLNELLLLLGPVRLSKAEDRWGWRPEKGEAFTVKSTYGVVSGMLLPRGAVSIEQQLAFSMIWKCPAPSKVAGFAWLVIHDRVSTRENLIYRRVIQDNGEQGCVFCGERMETVNHLFLYCNFTLQVWLCACNFRTRIVIYRYLTSW
jgi:hypothetical protein